MDIISDFSVTIVCNRACKTILMEFYLLLSCTHLLIWVQKWKQKLYKTSSPACCTSFPFAKITTLNVRQLINSVFVFERICCWSGRARGGGEEGVVVCFGEGPFPEVMSNMYYLKAESRKKVIHLSCLWSIYFLLTKSFAVGWREEKAWSVFTGGIH